MTKHDKRGTLKSRR